MAGRFSVKEYLPFSEGFIDVDGARMHYFDEGPKDGQVVLLLHGNPTWSFYYRNLIKTLRNDFRVIAPDFIGCGLSDRPKGKRYRAIERVDHLEKLLSTLGINKFSLVMHDWGAPIGSKLAVRDPNRIERLVYLNTTLTETENLPGFIKSAARGFTGRFFTQHTNQFVRLMLRFGVSKPLSAPIRAGYIYPYKRASQREAIWGFVQDIPFESNHPSYSELQDLAHSLPKLRAHPVLIIWGLQDPCFHRGMLKQVSGHFPQAQIIEIANASHLVLEDAGETARENIRNFLLGKEVVAQPTHATSSEIQATNTKKPSSGGLWGAFQKTATKYGRSDAVIVPDLGMAMLRWFSGAAPERMRFGKMTFGQLFDQINQYQRGLEELGLRRNDKVLMLVPPGIDFLALSYAVMGRGAIPCFVDPGMGKENMRRCLNDLDPDCFIGSPKAQLLRFLNSDLFKKMKFRLSASDFPLPGVTNLGFLKRFSTSALPAQEVADDDIGLIAFTSGGTGTPKGVEFTNAMLTAQLNIFENALGLKAGSKDLPLLPIFALFSSALGVCSVFPPLNPSKPLELEPGVMCRIIDECGITSSFGSPTLWNKIADYCLRHNITLNSIAQIFMAGAPVPPPVLAKVQKVAPSAEVATPYGATEALPVTLIKADQLTKTEIPTAQGGEIGTPVGTSVAGVDMCIIESADNELSDMSQAKRLGALQIGEVIARGANVSPRYLNRPDATRLSKIKDGDSFWHRMGDLGYTDMQGNLYFCGRKAHAVSLPGQIFYSDPVERIFNQHPRVRRSALVALHTDKAAAVVVEPLPEHWPDTPEKKARFINELHALGNQNHITTGIQHFFFHPSFPVDARHNAKIFRDKLGEWASQHSPESQPPQALAANQ